MGFFGQRAVGFEFVLCGLKGSGFRRDLVVGLWCKEVYLAFWSLGHYLCVYGLGFATCSRL